jgi:hypothetical protein
MSLHDKEENDLSESVDSHQAALDLAAAMPHVEFDLFLTFTCNRQLHPGVKHLHKFKESMEWNGFIPGYLRMSLRERRRLRDPDQFRCRVPHPLRYRIDPTRHEFRPLKFEFSKECLQILEECGIYNPNPETHGQDLNYWRGGSYQKDGYPKGSFNDKMFCRRRHYGPCNPNSTENMSPVNPVLFAATKSMQNLQVVRNTNGVARYVVKYVVKKDKGNRITLGANFHSGARMNADEKFLHNTKITRS